MKAQTRLTLLDGKYICPIAYPLEYDYLREPEVRDEVDRWLRDINMRLARLGTDGAFFMAPVQLQSEDVTRIKNDFLSYRDTYGPAHRMMQLIRAGKDEFTLSAGELVQLAELNQAVNESATLEAQLRGLQAVIKDGSARFTNRELLKKLLDHLRADGYLVLVNANTEMYQTTGKVRQLTSVLTFIAENTDILGQTDADDDADANLFGGGEEAPGE